ncbi:hypothetical protein [Nonomuraea sp. SYSU D8015]|uniref:hypothetical protein n=1 Tax=Nonomuraea sp. SYSU D8015 TaxID=2593644 RepID=UPI0016603BAB|nr:hypothetical protein [Nonomuraea sp. SYSU D8015]
MTDKSMPANDAGPASAGHGRNWKKATAVIGTATALVGLTSAVVSFTRVNAEDDSPAIAITAPETGAGATASACPMIRGTAKVAEGLALIVAVRRTTGIPRAKTHFYRVDTIRPTGQWNVTISLEADNPTMAGQWYSITAFTMPSAWADFLERLDGTADGVLMVASTMPPHEGETPSIDVQREAGQGFC